MSSVSLSHCGRYVAVLTGDFIQAHSLVPGPPSAAFGLRGLFAGKTDPISVHQIEWERVLPGRASEKYAVQASCGSTEVVAILSVSGAPPLVIHADPLGFDSLQWFPAVPDCVQDTHNSTMIAVFSAAHVHAKVYSLVSGQVVVTVPKPSSHVIFHPHQPKLWSIVAQPYHAKHSSQRQQPSVHSRLCHFYTDGVTCSQIVTLALPGVSGSAAKWEWSLSGRWLSNIDPDARLGGPDVCVYNLFGIHRGHVTAPDHVTRLGRAHPTVVARSELPATLWGSGPDGDYVLRYGDEFDSGRAPTIKMQTVSIQSLAQGKVHDISLGEGAVWSHYRDLDLEIKYSRLARVPPAKFRWSRGFSFGERHVIASDKNVCILKGLEPVTSVFGDSRFLDIFEVGDCFVVAYADHVSVLHAGAHRVLATSRYFFSKVSFVCDDDELLVSLVEDTPNGPLWRRVARTLASLTEDSPEVTDTFQNKPKRR